MRGDRYAARARAARHYADLDRPQLGAKIGVSKETISRIESGERPVDRDLREQIAVACGVPPAFMELGFEPLEARGVDQRVAELEAILQERVPETEAWRDGAAVLLGELAGARWGDRSRMPPLVARALEQVLGTRAG